MTAPRQILPGKTYLFTRRCLHRLFLMVPSVRLNNAFGYLLAVAARRHKIELHAWCVVSNHYHLILSDPFAQLPRFAQELNMNLALFLNTLHERFESAWAPGSYSAVSLEDEGSVIAKAAYTLANPVAAGLVEHGSHWPGLWSSLEELGTGREYERPEMFFSKDGNMPDRAVLALVPPKGFSAERYRESVKGALAALEKQAARTEDGERRKFAGLRRVLRQQWWQHPAGKEPPSKLNPKIAASDRWKRIEAQQQLKAFQDAYRKAFELFRKGMWNVVFPPGTWAMGAVLGAACAPPV
ncbi:MAG: transposase [Anaeromyxobacteraceae bacterium]